MFGVLTMHLTRLVNYGHSYEGAEDLFDLLSNYPLQHSFFHLFKPKRKLLPFPKPQNNDAGLSNFHFIEYDRDNGTAAGKYHSDVGTKTQFQSHPIDGLIKKKVSRQEGGEKLTSSILRFK